MPWWYAVAERDHELQNPTSAEKIRLLGERLRLGPHSRVLDVGCGKCGPALVLARAFGCRVVGVEKAPEFVAAARERIAAAGLAERIEVHEADGRDFAYEREALDVGMCLGASWIWDGFEGTLAALAETVRGGGHVVVGEPYWRRWPLPDGVGDDGFVPLAATVARVEAAGLAPVGLIASSEDDWDRYESLHWRAIEEWLAEHPDDPQAREFRERHEHHKRHYLEFQREWLGWAIFVARKAL